VELNKMVRRRKEMNGARNIDNDDRLFPHATSLLLTSPP